MSRDVIFENTKAMGDVVETKRVVFHNAAPTVVANTLLYVLDTSLNDRVMEGVRESIKEEMQ